MSLFLCGLCVFSAFIQPETGSVIPGEPGSAHGYLPVEESVPPGIGEWTSSGPWGGNLKAIVASVSDDDIVLAGCGFSMTPDAGGVWRSTDGGITWVETELSPIPVNAMCSGGPAAPNTFYAGTRTGLYVSNDNGITWDTVSGMATAYVIGIGVNSADSGLLIAGLSSNTGIRRSTDGGLTWSEVGLSTGYMKGFGCDPDHPDTMYVAMSGLDYSLYRSTDAGASWSSFGPSGSGWGLLVAPFGTGETMIVTTSDGFYMSTDSGTNWALAVPGGSYAPAVCDGTNLYAPVNSAGGVYESTDLGETWNLNTQGIVASYWQAGSSSSAGYLVGHYGGIYRTSSPGESYNVSQQGIGNGYIHAVSYMSSTGALLAGGEHHGLWKSTDQGQSWNIVFPGPANWVIYDIAPKSDAHYTGDVRYLATADGVFRSDDAGDSWARAGFTGTQISSVAFNPANPDIAWAGTATTGVHYTTNGGTTWTAGSGFPFALYPSIELIELSPGVLRILVSFQQSGTGVYYSDDGGVSYTTAPVPGAYHPGISTRWTDGGMAYLATDNGIYRSYNRGETWEACPGSSGLLWSVEGSMNSSVFSGTNGTGIRWSPDEGGTWQLLNTGIENKVVWDIVYGQNETQLFAGLRGFGVAELTDSQLGIGSGEHTGSSISLSLSSNPVTSSVSFTVAGINGAPAELAVYSSAGRLLHMETVLNSSAFIWTPEEEIPTGVYLVRVCSAGQTANAKLVLIR
jgi:photosystem II stability/assembly factor-like uncharacterized protein